MNSHIRVRVSKFLIISFLLFLIPSDTVFSDEQKKSGLELITEGEALFKTYQYRESINKFLEAEKIVKNEKDLLRIYLGISRSYYAMGLMTQVREAINKLASMRVEVTIRESEFPRGYLKIYKRIMSESKKSEGDFIIKTEDEPEKIKQTEKTGEETRKIIKKEEKPDLKKEVVAKTKVTGIVEKPGVKKKKKKSGILPILLGAAALGAVAVLLGGKKSDGDQSVTDQQTVSVHLESSPSGADVYVDGASKGVTTPCDITVTAGRSPIIRLVIPGWGETTRDKHLEPDQSYTMSAQIPPYTYQLESGIQIHSSVKYGDWDVDHDGNIYGIYISNGEYHLVKYDSGGSESFNRTLHFSSSVSTTLDVHVNNSQNEVMLLLDSSDIIYRYDTEGGYVGGPYYIKGFNSLSVNNSGNIFITHDYYDKVEEYNSNFEFIRVLLYNQWESNFIHIKCSDDNDHLFALNWSEKKLDKYNLSGNLVHSWSSRNAQPQFQFDKYLSSFGTGELEKVYVKSKLNTTFQVEIFNGNGDLLTVYENSPDGKIAEDNSYNFYQEQSTGYIQKLAPSGETEGSGIWEISSVASTILRNGMKSPSGINPLRNQKAKKPEIKKEKENLRSKKR